MVIGSGRDSAQVLSCVRNRPNIFPLLTTTALIPAITALAGGLMLVSPDQAFAQDGGNGGGGGGAGGVTNTVADQTGGTGGNGVAAGSGGGGGGAGSTSGAGGTGAGGTAGGSGAVNPFAAGQDGADAVIDGNGGGGGGGGDVFGSAGQSIGVSGSIALGRGGAGGDGRGSGSGGGGGAGSFGLFQSTIPTGTFAINASSSLTGGAGGAGGAGGLSGNGGDGGDGGAGFIITSSTSTIGTGAAIVGGAGGNGGSGVMMGIGGAGGAGLIQTGGSIINQGTLRGGNGGTGSMAGTGGFGLIGTDVTIDNMGLIAGGFNGSGAQALSLQLSGASTITNLGTLVGGIQVASGALTFDLSGDRTLSTVVSGAGGLIKRGTNTLTLSATNTYNGLTTVSAGTLEVSNSRALGTTGAGTIVEAGAALVLNGSIDVADALTLSGTGVGGTGVLRTLGRNSTLLGAITLGTDVRIETTAGSSLSINGMVSGVGRTVTFGGGGVINIQAGSLALGSGSVIKEGSGILALAGFNTYTGDTTIRGGELQFGFGNALSDTGRLTLEAGTNAAALFNAETIGSLAGSGTLFLQSNGSIIVGDASDTVFSGVIRTAGGDGTITKRGTGRLTLSGASTYTGLTTVSAGTLRAASATAFGTTDAGTTVEAGGAVEVEGNITIAEAFSIAGNGVANGGAIRFVSGSPTLSGGITLTADARINSDSIGAPNIAAFINSTGGNLTLGGSGNLTVGGLIRIGARTLTKDGTGTVTLRGANTYTGLTTVSAGTLAVNNDTALGTTDAGTIVEDGAALTLVVRPGLDSSLLVFEALTLNGTGVGGTGALRNTTGTNTLAGAITLGSDTRIEADAGASLGIFGVISGEGRTLTFGGDGVIGVELTGVVATGSGSVIKEGNGHLLLAGVNTYTGDTHIKAGSFEFAGGSALSDTGRLTLDAGTRTQASISTETIGSLAGSGALNLARGASLIVGDATDTTFNGIISETFEPGAFTKQGTGTLTLGGANTFTGGTTVNAGTLAVIGSLASGVTVNGGTLGGTGMIGGLSVINSGGTLAAGLSPGTLTFADLTLNAGSLTSFELGQAGVAGGANNDLIVVTGTLTLNGGNIGVVQNTGFGAGQYSLFQFGSLAGALGNLTLNPLTGGFTGNLALGANTVLLSVAAPVDLAWWNGTTTSPTGAVVGGSGTWNLTNGNFTDEDGAFSGAWAGNGTLAVFGGTAGTVTIAADTALSPSGLNFVSDGYIINGANAGSTLLLAGPTGIDTAANVGATINAVISGTGSLTKNGAGTLTLGGVNTFTGSTTVLGGTLVNSGTITGAVTNNAVLTSTGSLLGGLINSAGAAANLAGTANGQVNNSGTVNVTGNLAGNNAFANSGAGVLNVSGGNYTGLSVITNSSAALNGINVSAGRTLSAQIISNSAGASILNAGTITTSNRIDNSGTLTTTGTINGGSAGLRGLAGSTINAAGIINGAVSTAGTFNVTGNLVTDSGITNTGTLNLTGASLSTVGLINSAGSTANARGTLNGTVQNSGTFNVTGNLINSNNTSFGNAGTGVLNVSGGDYTGLVAVTNNSTATNAINVAAGRTLSAQIVSNSAGRSILNAGTISTSNRLENNGILTSTGTINGIFLNNAGASAALQGAVNGAVTNSGTITLTGGLTVNGAVTQNSTGSVNLAGFNATLGSLAGSGTVSLGAGRLTVGGNGTATTFSGVISGDGGLTKTGSGNFTLSGANTYLAETSVDQGTLTLVATGAIAGRVRVNGATFNNIGTVSGSVINLGTLASTGTIQGGLTQFAGSSGTVAGVINGPINTAGALIVSANLTSNDFAQTSGTGTVQILSGARWSGLTGFTNASTSSAGVQIAGTLDVSGIVGNFAGATLTVGNGGRLTAQNMANLGTVTNNGTVNTDITNSGTITNNAIWNGGLSQGTGSVTNASEWNGFFLIDAGGRVTNNFVWTNNSGFTSAIRDGSFTNFNTLSGGGISVSGANALLDNRAGGTISLTTGQSLFADSLGVIRNAGMVTANAQVLAGGVVQNLGSGRWTGQITVAANGSLNNDGTITGTVANAGIFRSTGTLTGQLSNQTGGVASLAGTLNGTIANSGTITLIGETAGIGAVTQTPTGTFNLAGFDTTFASLSGRGSVALGAGTLTISDGTSQAFGGVISGSGGLVKNGSRDLRLSGANTYTGLTRINQGTIVLETSGSLAGSVLNNANFMTGGTVAGLVTNNGTLFSVGRLIGGLTNNGSAQLAGQIDGAVTNNGTITNIGGVTVLGRFTQTANGSLNIAGLNSAFGSLDGAGTIALGSGFLAVGGDNSTSTFSGVASGTGGLVKLGSGTFTVTGVNSYTGSTIVEAGTLVIGDGGGDTGGGDTMAGDEPLELNQAMVLAAVEPTNRATLSRAEGGLTGGRTSVSLSGLQTAAVLTPTPELASEQAESGVTANTATLASAVIAGNVFNFATVINNGTILGQLSNAEGATATNHGVIDGAVFNDGTLVSTGTLGGGLSNNGTAMIEGVLDGDVLNDGTIVLTGTTAGIGVFEQTEAGVFDLAGFETEVGVLMGAGNVRLGDATLITGTDGIASLFSGVISGTGALDKVGTGRLVLTGTNTYIGGTTISEGVLQLGDGGTGGSIIGPVVNNGALVINRSDAVTFANVVSGTGMFVQDGTGTTTLTGANTYTGGTLISRGRLVGTTMSLRGVIQNDAALEFAQATGGIFAGQIGGAGLFDKTGAGLLELTGNNSAFTGGTFVRAGELRVSGLLNRSRVTVLSGATLSGTGTLGGLIANSGSFIDPGANGVGVLGVNGAIDLQAGSTVRFQVGGATGSDAIVSNGAAQLGGTAALTNLGAVQAFNSSIVLLQADGGRSGAFGTATGLNGFGILYRPELVYTGTQVLLRFAPNMLANIVGTAALTENQRSVLNGIDAAVVAGYNPQPLFNIYNLPTAQLAGAFDQLSGEVYAATAGAGIEQERLVREAVLGRISAVALAAREAPERAKGAGAWAQVFGGWGHGDSDGNAARFEADRTGFATGIDVGNANDTGSWRAGVFGMQIQSDVSIDALGSRGEVEQTGGGVYASVNTGGFGAAIGGYLTGVDLRAFRSINLPGFAQDNVGTAEGKGRQAFAELSYTIEAGSAAIRPFIGGAVGSFKLDGLTETGGSAALALANQSYSTGSVTAGIDGSVTLGKALRLGGTLAGRTQLGDRDPQAQLALAAAPQQSFGVSGAQLDKTALAARFDATLVMDEKVSFSVGYTGLIGSTVTDHGARATLQVQF